MMTAAQKAAGRELLEEVYRLERELLDMRHLVTCVRMGVATEEEIARAKEWGSLHKRSDMEGESK